MEAWCISRQLRMRSWFSLVEDSGTLLTWYVAPPIKFLCGRILIESGRENFPRSISTAQTDQNGIPNIYRLMHQCRILDSHSALLLNQLRMVPAIKSTLWGALNLVNYGKLQEAPQLEPSGFFRFQALSGPNYLTRQRPRLQTRKAGFHQNVKLLENTTSSTMAGRAPRAIPVPLPVITMQMPHSCSMSTL